MKSFAGYAQTKKSIAQYTKYHNHIKSNLRTKKYFCKYLWCIHVVAAALHEPCLPTPSTCVIMCICQPKRITESTIHIIFDI